MPQHFLIDCYTHMKKFTRSAINGTNVYVIYAQTEGFTITSGACVAPTNATSAPGVVTVTVTAEVTCGSSTFLPYGSTPQPQE